MTQILNSSNSKTQIIISIDDDNNEVIDKEVAKTLHSIIETIETLPQITKIIQIDENESSEDEELNKESDKLVNNSSKDLFTNVLINGRVVRPVDEVEDIDNMEVNIYTRSDDSDYDESEAEDCMVIEDMTDYHFQYQRGAQEENNVENGGEEEDDDDIEIIENNDTNERNQKKETNEEQVIDLSDDEEDCVIIDDSFSMKLNKIIKSDGDSHSKSSKSPIYSSDSFIPLSEPSTSSGFSSEPFVRFRGLRGADRRHRFESNDLNSCYSSFPSSSLKNLFTKPSVKTTYNNNGNENIRFVSTYINQNNESTEEDRLLYDDTIPFLYEEVKPSTSSETIVNSIAEDIDLISESVKLDRNIVQNVVNLIEDQCTIPFIVRYRQSAISGIDAERVRKISSAYNELKSAREKAADVIQILKKQNRVNPRLKTALNRCKTVFEVEHLFSLCRNESQDSEKYRNLGLGDSAFSVLEGKRLEPNHFINRFAIGLDTPEKIMEGWCAIIADIISKDCDVLEFLINATRQHIPSLHIIYNNEKANEMRIDFNPKNLDLIQKYLRFKDFEKQVNKINAHTYMAIERGETLGLLNVFVEFETIILDKLIEFCLKKWNRCGSQVLINCVRIAFNNQLKPSLEEYIRFELRHTSHMTALDVFRSNVKHLLLEPPLRGEFVIGVDPGYDSGYKVIVVSPWLVPLDACVLKLDSHNYESSAIRLRKLMIDNRCSIIALGNGSGCRKFEDMLHQKIKSGFFGSINVKYKIINESGVSYYSVTEEAKKDLPNFPPHMIGAISIARRLIDPLSELVKVDPKRLQVGMYMRDINEEMVKKAFHEVAVECVSFCGVDVNVASLELLSKVSGLESTIARMIIEKRDRDGLFNSRSQLRNINGIGWKQFEQCAGFIKVMPLTRRESIPYNENKEKNCDFPNKRRNTSTDDYDPLDSTIIHPESYSCANTYLELIGASKDEIGKQSIRAKIESGYKKYSLPEIASLCNTHSSIMKLIIEGLSNSLDFDYRTNFAQIYIPEIQHFDELSVGMQLKGRVVNVTPMGAFIDCGIIGSSNAYLNAKECDRHVIVVNDNVLVEIQSIKKMQQRFSVNIVKVFKK